MKTSHQIVFDNSYNMNTIPSESISLVVTSPLYPMIKMWNEIFISQNPAICNALKRQKGPDAFELMHRILDDVWFEKNIQNRKRIQISE